jgi:hypothetical protein
LCAVVATHVGAYIIIFLDASCLLLVQQQLEAVHKNGTNDKCYAAVADLLCLWCSPDTSKFTEARRTTRPFLRSKA